MIGCDMGRRKIVDAERWHEDPRFSIGVNMPKNH